MRPPTPVLEPGIDALPFGAAGAAAVFVAFAFVVFVTLVAPLGPAAPAAAASAFGLHPLWYGAPLILMYGPVMHSPHPPHLGAKFEVWHASHHGSILPFVACSFGVGRHGTPTSGFSQPTHLKQSL